MPKHNIIEVGQKFDTKYGKCKVIEYEDSKNLQVRFLQTWYQVWVSSGNLRKGNVKDLLVPTILGVACVGVGKYSPTKDKKLYSLFKAMLDRSCDPVFQAAHGYEGTTVDPRWLNFQNFCQDVITLPNWNAPNFELDKDCIVIGNRHYSLNTCSFIPKALNNSIRFKGKGYWIDKSSFVANVPKSHKHYFDTLYFKTKKEAKLTFARYRRIKFRELAIKFKKQIDPRVYKSLYNYPLRTGSMK